MNLQMSPMKRVDALHALGASKRDGTAYDKGTRASVTADGCFFFWEDELHSHDQSTWTVKRLPDKSVWPVGRNGSSFYKKLHEAHDAKTKVRVALNRIKCRKANGDRVAASVAYPVLWHDGAVVYGDVIHIDLRDFSVEIQFGTSARSAQPEMQDVDDTFRLEALESLMRPCGDRIATLPHV